MLWTVGSLSVVVAAYLGGLYWSRAGAKWGLGVLASFLVVMGVLMGLISLLSSALGVPYFIQIWIACVLWLIVTLVAGIRTDALFETKFRAAGT